MTTTRIFSNPRQQLQLSDGSPNSFGKIYFYEPGAGSTTDKAVYRGTDFVSGNEYKQPIDLDGSGRPPIIYPNGDYRVVVYDKYGNKVDDAANYQLAVSASQYAKWEPNITYKYDDIAEGSDGRFYSSLDSINKGNDPISSASKWVQVYFITSWSSLKSFQVGAICEKDGQYFKSKIDENLNKNPFLDRASWDSISIKNGDLFNSDYSYLDGSIAFYDGRYYQATRDVSAGESSPGLGWVLINLVYSYSSEKTYRDGDNIILDRISYVSLQDGNAGNLPTTSPLWWGSQESETFAYTNNTLEIVNSDTLTDDANLSVSLSEGVYALDCELMMTALSSGIDIKASIVSTSSLGTSKSITALSSSGTSNPAMLAVAASGAGLSSYGLEFQFPCSFAAGRTHIKMSGIVEVLTAGTMTVQLAQLNFSASYLRRLAGSYIRFKRLS